MKRTKLKNEYITLEKITLEEFVKRSTEEALIKAKRKEERTGKKRDPKISTRKLHWYHLIATEQLTCPVSKIKVAYGGYDREEHKNTPPTFHYNFYSENGELFTIDHKLPISMGGSKYANTNVQPMLAEHNYEKSNSLIYM